jgi:hypothetical protein
MRQHMLTDAPKQETFDARQPTRSEHHEIEAVLIENFKNCRHSLSFRQQSPDPQSTTAELPPNRVNERARPLFGFLM